jgi:hypothetical protein
MHAVVVSVTIPERERALQYLHEVTVPRVTQAPGFAAGCWVDLGGTGRSIVVFDSEEAAREAAGRVEAMLDDSPVTVESVQIGEVVAYAGQLPGA